MKAARWFARALTVVALAAPACGDDSSENNGGDGAGLGGASAGEGGEGGRPTPVTRGGTKPGAAGSGGADDRGGRPGDGGSTSGGAGATDGGAVGVVTSPQAACDNDATGLCIVGSAFDQTIEDWSVYDLGYNDANTLIYSEPVEVLKPTVALDAGNPGGALSMTDPSQDVFYFCAPPSFLEASSAAYGGTLAFDLNLLSSGQTFEDADVILGNGEEVLLRLPEIAVDTAWQSHELSLQADDRWRTGALSGEVASEATFRRVLDGLTQLCIRGEYIEGVSETALIDNVYLRAAIETE